VWWPRSRGAHSASWTGVRAAGCGPDQRRRSWPTASTRASLCRALRVYRFTQVKERRAEEIQARKERDRRRRRLLVEQLQTQKYPSHARACTRAHTRAHMHTRVHPHTCAHAPPPPTHTHTHARTHSQQAQHGCTHSSRSLLRMAPGIRRKRAILCAVYICAVYLCVHMQYARRRAAHALCTVYICSTCVYICSTQGGARLTP
jgi:hypothetical protein